jgi:hypothetical protein
MSEQKPSLDDWSDFSGEFLKAQDVKDFPFVFVPVTIDSEYSDQNKAKVFISGLYNGKTKKIGLNNTNIKIIQAKYLPKQIIGKKITFDKIMNRNPTTGLPVLGFIISKIE